MGARKGQFQFCLYTSRPCLSGPDQSSTILSCSSSKVSRVEKASEPAVVCSAISCAEQSETSVGIY